MTPPRAQDYMPRPASHPAEDFRGLRRILTMFAVGIVVCAGFCAATIIREARGPLPVPHPATACTCMGACLRH